jgi:sporulation protein YlmC with PRC-barrel domain
MKHTKESTITCRLAFAASLTACVCMGFSVPLPAAQSPDTRTVQHPTRDTSATPDMKPAQKCLSDLSAFNSEMRKNGYWLRESGYGFGYGDGSPMYGYSSGEPYTLPPDTDTGSTTSGVPAQNCESLLKASRAIYKSYAADLGYGHSSTGDVSDWRTHQIANAQPVTGVSTSFRSAELIGTSVVSPQREDLGSVNDIVLSPKTGKIVYLVVGSGGMFGIDEKYVPVPWADFKATAGVTLLVLDTTKGKMDAAPEVKERQFSARGDFQQQSQKVDNYWQANLSK